MQIDAKQFRNKLVILTTVRGAMYKGTVVGIRDGKTCMSSTPLHPMYILHKDGTYKACPKNGMSRWFNNSSIKSIICEA